MAGFSIGDVQVGAGTMFVIAGPCVIESEDMCLRIAERLAKIGQATGVGMLFKASFDKANRSSIDSFRGPGMEKGLKVLAKIRQVSGLAIVTDIHESGQAAAVAEVADCIQIPAFLSRQTDLLVACGQTGKVVNIKKGQFVSPDEMKNAVAKVRSTGNEKILLTERGTFFGYNRLVNDMTAIPAMKLLAPAVVFDATHSTQRPGGLGTTSGGMRQMAPVLARAAIAAGADGLFMEVHPEPEKALCDAACMLELDRAEEVIRTCKAIHEIVNSI